ncbi:MAG TPA: Gfo/Idh/MocA family oxidoreductase [bacterium]|nr:Gfo/Idh/MocA family oxidoreductase [bacterium]
MLIKPPPQNNYIRFGIVGCGAITEEAYLPVFRKSKRARLTCLVDPDDSRTSALRQGFDICYSGKDLDAIFDHVDAVIVAAPNHLHYSITKACLEAGKHVLCEKPITITSQECKKLISIATKHSLILGVAHVRRFYPAVRKIKEIVMSKNLGNITSFEFKEGTVFSWSTVSGFYFDRHKSGGGVLMDIGTHLLDLLFWWLPFDIEYFSYEDDNLGGVEAFAKIDIGFTNSVNGTIELSRLSILKNFYTINFEEGTLQWNPLNPRKLYVWKGSKRQETIKIKKSNSIDDLFNNFTDAIQNQKSLEISGSDALKTVQFVESCYQSRKLLPLEWLQPNSRLEHLGKNINS